MATHQRPLELILARNFLSSLSTPAFLIDNDGKIAFFNESAAELLGKRFEEVGSMTPQEWGDTFGPFDAKGERIPFDQLPLTLVLRSGKPAHARFHIRSASGIHHDVHVSALPIVSSEISKGAIVFFWAAVDGGGDGSL